MIQAKKTGKIVALTALTVMALFFLLFNVAVMEQSLEIKASSDRLFELINRPAHWAEWYAPLQDPSGVKSRLTGTSAGRGAGMKWATGGSRDAGTGMMRIRKSKNNRNVTAVVAINDNPSAVMNFKIRPAGTDVSRLTIRSRPQLRQNSLWHDLRLMFDRSGEPELVVWLNNIDQAATTDIGGIKVFLQRVEPFSYIGIVDSCAMDDMSLLIQHLYGELLVFGNSRGLDMTKRPLVIYHRMDENNAVIETGIPVAGSVPVSGRIRYQTMPEKEHAVADHYGSLDALEDGHHAVQRWMTRNGRSLTAYPWEMYVTDPAEEPDPNKWLTRIYYPVN